MTRTRQYLAERARLRRQIEKKLLAHQLAARRLHISEVLNQIKEILSDKKFADLLFTKRIKTAPKCLCEYAHTSKEFVTDEEIANGALIFVVAWKFFFPLIGDSAIAEFIERNWPGFIADFKDTFIGLVMDGPFPGERRTPVRPAHFS